jgi:hypothetical protein
MPLLGVTYAGYRVSNPFVLAYHYPSGAISYWMCGLQTAFMWNGVSVLDGGQEKVYVVASPGLNMPYVCRVGVSNSDVIQSAGDGIPIVWWSARHYKGNEEYGTFRHVRLRVKSWGKNQDDCTFFMEGEEAAFDSELEGVVNTDRQAFEGLLPLHWSEEVVARGGASNTYFFYTGKWDTATWGADDWFTARIDPSSVRSRWCQIGIVDYDPTAIRGPVACIQDYTIEAEGSGSLR